MGILVAADTVFDAGNPFFPVFGNDVRLLMLVAAKAGVAPVIASQVAGRAGRVVISVKYEETAVIERCGPPGTRLVTGCASRWRCPVHFIAGRHMAGLALGSEVRHQQSMVKFDCACPSHGRLGMIAVTGHAIRLAQRLVKGCRPHPLRNRYPLGGSQTNIGYHMAGCATIG